jgi:cytochrome c556
MPMNRKLRIAPAAAKLVAIVLAVVLASGTSARDESPIQKIMDQVQTRNRAIGKGLRPATAIDRKALAAAAASLIRLGKDARMLTDPAKERMKPQQEWTLAVDDFIRASNDFAKVIAAPNTSRPEARQSYQKLQKTCANCHSTFR